MADADTKIYVGGLAPETSTDDLRDHFGKYGDIVDCIVMVDKATSQPRGFGFVTFKDATAATETLGTTIILNGREVTCRKAVKDVPKQIVQDGSGIYNRLKIFVGGLPSSCNDEKLVAYFGRFGAIQDAVVMMDQQTQRHRGFGYVTFADPGAVEAALQMYSDNKIDGKWIEVKRCIPQESIRTPGASSGAAGGSFGGTSKASENMPDGGSSGSSALVASGGDPRSATAPESQQRWDSSHYASWYAGDPYAAYRMAPYGMGYAQPGYPYGAYGAYGMSAYHQAYGVMAAYGMRYERGAGSGHRMGPY